MRNGKDDRVSGTLAQALLDRCLGRLRLKLVIEDHGKFISALMVDDKSFDARD